ncbi:MAG: signal peptidase I [Acholeplasma sp.]|nr:signal peptidase I [Acholeplasma sp.]
MENSNKGLIKTLKIVGNVLFYFVIVFLLFFSIANLQVKSNKDVANVFKRGFMPVLSDSMEGDENDSFNKGDLLFVRILSDKQKESLKKDDIITFYDLSISALNTHRVKEVTPTYVITQGDKAALSAEYIVGEDNSGKDYQIVSYDNIKAIQTGTVPSLGSAVNYLQTPVGFALFIILPVVILLGYQGFVLTKTLLAVNKEKLESKYALEREASLKDLEAEKEKIRKELLEEMNKNKK